MQRRCIEATSLNYHVQFHDTIDESTAQALSTTNKIEGFGAIQKVSYPRVALFFLSYPQPLHASSDQSIFTEE